MVAPRLEVVGDCTRIIYGDPIFVYSAYWGHWSRRLMSERSASNSLRYLDYSVEPIRGRGSNFDEWSQYVLPICLRFHSTVPVPGDKVSQARDLPISVISLMYAMIGEKRAAELLYTDVYPIIDRTALEFELGRGSLVPLEKVREKPCCPICHTSTFIERGTLSYLCHRSGCNSSFIPD